ncbi:hypothetical protein Acor_41210 [Acrocarpospora corrugata]|uniref:Uncharacterized protein n=1 Tax=Acrocarpospora corrugata TaxID=35763 RepID=A0A5M3VZW4_9ACTN|nr:hypothetical protein [Acrocarpospora corrugata]GES02056.1 hypothetical protein Acor_41210 [Acrocarpospora corrugata]
MADLDFFVDLMITGTVLGLDHTSELVDVEKVLGRDSTVEVYSGMISNFGLVEFGWWRDRPEDAWRVNYFGAQTQRLSWLADENQIETSLVDRYGQFRPRLDFGELRDAVQARGFALEERPSINDGLAEYGEPTSRMGLLVVSDPEEWDEPPGTVLKMLGPGGRNAWLPFQGREQAFKSNANHLLTLPEPALVTWLDKREPHEEPVRTDWWAYLRNVVARRTGGTPAENARWRLLGFALDRHAAQRGIDTADEAAAALVVSLIKARDLRVAVELPTMDEAVERWLTATTTMANATRLCAERPLDPAEIRLSRRLRNQIHVIQPCLPYIASAALADELRAWIELKHSLLRWPVADITSNGLGGSAEASQLGPVKG